MVFLPRIIFGFVPFFSDTDTQESIESGRSKLPLSQLGGVSEWFSVSLLQSFLAIFVTPNFAPPNWWPVLPFAIQNPVDPFAWIGSVGNDPIDPRDDPFYHPDVSTYQSAKNGDVLDIREIGLSVIWASVKKAYQVSYRTESTLGWPQADITTIMIPYVPNGKVVSYQMWEDATSLQCSPSYSIVTGISDPTFDILLLLGYVVNWPDHEGKNSSFAAGIKEGKSCIDSLRAFLSVRSKIGLDTDSYNKIIMWGYSGGSIPTGHASEMMPDYAPDLVPNIVGGIMGGCVVNITQVVKTINGGIFSGFAFAGVWGLGTEYPSIQQVIDEGIRPGIQWRWKQVGKTCIFDNLINNILQNFWSYTSDSSGKSILGDPRVYEPLQGEWLGVNAAPPFPMIVYQGVQDEIIDVKEVDRTVNHWCSEGTRVDYYRLTYLEHIGAEILSIIDALKWIAQLFNGYVPSSCSSYVDATLGTSLSLDSNSPQYDDIVKGNYVEAGILQLDSVWVNNGTSSSSSISVSSSVAIKLSSAESVQSSLANSAASAISSKASVAASSSSAQTSGSSSSSQPSAVASSLSSPQATSTSSSKTTSTSSTLSTTAKPSSTSHSTSCSQVKTSTCTSSSYRWFLIGPYVTTTSCAPATVTACTTF